MEDPWNAVLGWRRVESCSAEVTADRQRERGAVLQFDSCEMTVAECDWKIKRKHPPTAG